ncbi:hypothetical protein ROA7023_02075 [Roseisalinus antarcticus]|uniref:Major Facilitator Superfamily protein n=2 Tax=Roseisalinus antarcticus TaxID=254357 RepID=A0A1Y5SYU3_9RHOB|nr:hypothetical protein ROA7023_02075 [Roseisalinus antarcticus]
MAAALGARGLGVASHPVVISLILFGLMTAYHGVRQGRSTYLVDMAPEDLRAAYTAVSNTCVGVFLLAAGAVAAAIGAVSVPLVLGVFGVMCLAGALWAYGLDEVEDV